VRCNIFLDNVADGLYCGSKAGEKRFDPAPLPTASKKEVRKMDAAKMTKQMIDFQKTTFDNTFNAMVMLQDQAERMANTLLEQATWLPEEGRKAIRDWVAAYKNGREEFKTNVDQSFKKVEEFFEGAAQKKAEAKSK
jgi:hypothetical protein